MSKLTLNSLKRLVSLLTPVERNYLMKATCMLPSELQVPARALLSDQEIVLPEGYARKRFIRYMLEWIIDRLAIRRETIRYKLLGRWTVLSLLKWRDKTIEDDLMPILEPDKWFDDQFWKETYAPLQFERIVILIMSGHIKKDQIVNKLNSLFNAVVVQGIESLLITEIYDIISSFIELTPQAYDNLSFIGKELNRLLTTYRIRQEQLELPEVALFHIGILAILSRRFTVAKDVFKRAEKAIQLLSQDDGSYPMRLARVLYFLGFAYPYKDFLDTKLNTEDVRNLLMSLIAQTKVKKGRIVLSNQTAIINSIFAALRATSLFIDISLSLSEYIMLDRLSRRNHFFRVQFLCAIISSLFHKKESEQAYKKYLPLLSDIGKTFKAIKLIYYMWKFILEYELHQFDAMINTAHSAYQWNRRHNQPYNNLTLWMKRQSLRINPYLSQDGWKEAIDELLTVYAQEPFLMSLEEYCPVLNWLHSKGNIPIKNLTSSIQEIERKAKQIIPNFPFEDFPNNDK